MVKFTTNEKAVSEAVRYVRRATSTECTTVQLSLSEICYYISSASTATQNNADSCQSIVSMVTTSTGDLTDGIKT